MIFELQSYKSVLLETGTQLRSQFGSKFTFERMAHACGIQKTYLSRVLNGKSHLNPDQLFSACEFLKLDSTATEFTLILRELELTNHPKRRKQLTQQIEQIRKSELKIEKVIHNLDHPKRMHQTWEYYSDPDILLVHLALTIPRFASSPDALLKFLDISKERLNQILMTLQDWNLIQFQGEKYHLEDPVQHLPKDSPLFRLHSTALRQRTIEKIRKLDDENSFIFSTVFSADAALQNRLRKKILALLKETQADVGAAKSDDLFQMNIDFFSWT